MISRFVPRHRRTGLATPILGPRAILILAIVTTPPVRADSVTLTPIRDNTIYQDAVSNSNGAGTLASGETRVVGSRRMLLTFDIAANVPAGASIDSATLNMTITRSASGASVNDDYTVHRLLADWGEAGSFSSQGDGAAAQPGDVTWTERFFGQAAPWASEGAEFASTPSTSAKIPAPPFGAGIATWPDAQGLRDDVAFWLASPGSNFGWIILGEENIPRSVRLFASRESGTPPELVLEFTPPIASSPPAVPDGRAGTPLRVDRVGADLVLSWDTDLCAIVDGHHLIFGGAADLPSAPGSPFLVGGSVCGLGSSSPFVWGDSPDPLAVDPATGLLWFLVVADDGAPMEGVEGSWGTGSALVERSGPASDGNSGQCGIIAKDLNNTCGAP